MGLRHQYSTMIYSWDGTLSAEVFFLPKTDLLEPFRDEKPVLRSLDASFLAGFDLRDPGQALGAFIAAVAAGGSRLKRWQREIKKGEVTSLKPSDMHLKFAQELLMSSRIPFEESPLTAATLGQLVAKATPTGLGALIGWVVAGNTPLLLIYVPAGIIIVRCAVGVGRGLEEGLHTRIKKLFTRRG